MSLLPWPSPLFRKGGDRKGDIRDAGATGTWVVGGARSAQPTSRRRAGVRVVALTNV